ncbi:hypothetical protein [Prosthecochloris sp.]|uniref:hypothetical protein n=1 Tax=Prosthecochloris sp. TaxID=290513 RepID=UPI0025E94C84|nr:hypothetical protein [Prosthecochloris sp.]
MGWEKRRILNQVEQLINSTSAALERLGYSNEWTSEQLWDAVFRGRTGVECMSLDSMYDEGRLYQDANGTTPVTGVEQPVGLMLDGSQRQRLGPELVTNGDFSDGATGWSTAGTVESGRVTVEATGVSRALFKQEIQSNSAPVGSLYWLQYDVVENTLQPSTGNIIAVHNDSDFRLLRSTQLPSAVGTHRALVKRVGDTSGGLYVFLSSQQASGSITVDNISLRETYGYHPYQPADINSPVLSARVNGFKNTEDISANTWGKYSNATVTGTNVLNLPDVNSRLSYYWYTPAPVGTTAKLSMVLSGTGSITLRLARNYADGPLEFTDRKIDLTSTPTRYDVEHTMQYENQTGYQLQLVRLSNDTATQVTVTKADLRYTNDGVDLPEYQRVGDVDANPADYDWQNFPLYLAFNGTNQYLKVTGMQPEVDEVFVSAAIRKESDESNTALIELSNNYITNDYVFQLAAPSSSVNRSYRMASKGTIGENSGPILSKYAAPTSNVVTGISSISGNICLVRVDGVQEALGTDDQGVDGNYGNYNLYIGSRAGTSMFYKGRLYGILLVFDNPADTIITTIERELNRKAKIYA